MKDLGSLGYFLGLEVSSNFDGYYLSQAKYASGLLSQVGITDSKTICTLLKPNVKLTPLNDTFLLDLTLYCQLVGTLVSLTMNQPNVAYDVHLLCQFMAAPYSLVLSRYFDANWTRDHMVIIQPLVIVSSWVIISFLGKVRNNM